LIIRTGLVGFGLGGRSFHAPFIAANQNYELVSVVERKTSLSKAKYPRVKIARSMEELLQDDSLDLIVITTPNETHFSFAKAALEAGRNVVLDKPMTVASDEAAQLIKFVKEKKKLLSVYQSRRYASDALTIKALLERNVLGEIHEFEAQYNRYRPQLKNSWKETAVPGSGILYDLGPHLIDQALDLFGFPKTITADIRKQRPGTEADDYFDIRLDYGFNKVILKAGMLVREQGPRYQIHGTKGSFIKYGDDPQDAALRAGALPTDEGFGVEPEEHHGLLHTEIEGEIIIEKLVSEVGNFGLFYQNLYESIANGKPLTERAEHGYNVVKMIELAKDSNEQKRTIEVKGLLNS